MKRYRYQKADSFSLARGLLSGQAAVYFKKYKYILGVFGAAFVVLTIGTIWAGFLLMDRLFGSVTAADLQEKMMVAETKARSVISQPITNENCLSLLGSFFSSSKFLTVSIADNISSIKTNCLSNSGLSETKNN